MRVLRHPVNYCRRTLGNQLHAECARRSTSRLVERAHSRVPLSNKSESLSWLTDWLFLCRHFRASFYQGGNMSDVTIPGGKIRAFVERIENLDIEIQELNEQKKEVFAEAKGEGF